MKGTIMTGTISKILALLDRREKISAAGLLAFIILTALIETAGIASVVPFLAVLADPSIIDTQPVLKKIYDFTGMETQQQFLFFLGFVVLGVLIFTNTISALMNWAVAHFTHMRAHTISCRMLATYLHQPYSFFLERDSSEMATNILTEVSHVVKNAVVAGMQIVAKTIACIFILTLLVIVDPWLALVVTGILGVAYGLVYMFIHRKLARIGQVRIETNALRFKIFAEIFSAVKDIKVTGTEESFARQFRKPAHDNAMSFAQYEVISNLPRYVLETFAFGGMLVIILYLMSTKGSVAQILPVIGLYAFAGQRLLPALQGIFLNVSKVRYVLPSLNDMQREFSLETSSLPAEVPGTQALPFSRDIALKNISFRFGASDQSILDKLNLSIVKNTSVGIVGGTGAGKSTLIDIILGLLEPPQGGMEIDGTKITRENMRAWQKNLGYVSQNIVLLNDSFMRNVAFGLADHEIDLARIKQILQAARLDDFILNETPEGYNTIIGENGIRLSGGQRQRLGLARALYRDPPVLILDEATSALDNITEKEVMEAIGNLAHKKTIIMIAHRLSTVQNCDVIHYLEKGKVIASGTYDELLNSSQEFKKLARVGQG